MEYGTGAGLNIPKLSEDLRQIQGLQLQLPVE